MPSLCIFLIILDFKCIITENNQPRGVTMFNFGDLNNVPMLSGWGVCLVLVILLLGAVKVAKK
jgi:hypothetical protein